MCTHTTYTAGVGQYILACKKQTLDDYINCMEQGAPLDEIALVIVACMYHFHICVLKETKYWTTNWEHKIGMCSLLLGLTGNMQFCVLKYCMKQTGENNGNKADEVIENNLDPGNHHITSIDSCSSLTEKLAGVSDPEKISELIKLQAEQMSRPFPPPPIYITCSNPPLHPPKEL